jgi:hypothetical protein
MHRILSDLRSTKHSDSTKSKLSTILYAIEETIRDRTKRNGEIRATEYMGAVSAALDSTQSNENVPALVKMLSIVIPAVPDPVLRTLGQRFENLFIGLWRNDPDNATRRGLLTCATYYLVAQPTQAFTRPSLLRVLNVMFRGTTDSHSKTRRAAKTGTLRVLETQNEIVSSKIVSFAENLLATSASSSSDGESPTTLYLMSMLKTVAPVMSTVSVSKLITNVLLRTLKSIGPSNQEKQKRMTTMSISETLGSIFQNPKIQISNKVLIGTSRVLLECAPVVNGVVVSSSSEYTSSWSPALAYCIRAISQQKKTSLHDLSNLVAESAEAISRLMAHNHNETLRSVSSSLKTLSQCPILIPQVSILESTHSLHRILRSYASLLRPTFSHAWKHGVPSVGSLVGNLYRLSGGGDHLTLHVRSLILELDELRQGCEMNDNQELASICEHALSQVLNAMGVSEFLSIVTFHKRTTGPGVVSPERTWLLPFLHKHVPNSPCRLEYFRTAILGLART